METGRQLHKLFPIMMIIGKTHPCDYSNPVVGRIISEFRTDYNRLNKYCHQIGHTVNLFIQLTSGTSVNIVIGTETWLDPTIKDIEIFPEEYTLYRKDRKKQQGGGVLIAIKSDFISDEVEDLTPDAKSEMVWAKIEIKGSRSLYISSFYNPKTSDEQSIKWFDTSVKRATQIKNAAILIGGDFNLPGWDWKNKILKPKSTHQNIHYDFGNTLDDTGLVQLIEYPTRKDNILDLMITNLPNQVPRIEIMPGISDHDIVFMEFKITPSKLKQTPRNVPIYNKANWETIKKEVINLQHTIQEKVNTHTVDELWLQFKTKLNELVSEHIPHKKLTSKNKTPWVTFETRKLMKKRDRLYKKMKKSGNDNMRNKYKQIKHQFITMPRGRGRRRRQDPVGGGRELRIRRAPREQQQPPVRNERRRPQVEVDEDAPVVRRRRVDEPQLVALQPDVELQENEPQLAALAKNDIWIIGSSLVKKASEHTQTRATGIDLGLEKLGYSIVWIGHSGMLWDMVPSIITALLNWRSQPSIILIHCGGNDLCNIQNGKLLYNIRLFILLYNKVDYFVELLYSIVELLC
ncbi:unnamed protein product [Mytilus edulis]|uniref:Endonuclease/exonuclease/phosphatase domain-containing protein n=1 Tax=Mytilus edulis TaxID=6550 RepID=A0A8S3TBQ3_MYTED|nr:unnamed protein product [Mytilus edulis]